MSRAAGSRFERLAAQHLTRAGFRVLASNYTCRGGELDLVCDDAGTLVFVEVRARTRATYGTPGETVRATKQRRVIHAARHYLATHHLDEVACRFDVIAITVEDGAIEHFKNAFET
jgi:putative endonuclease